MAIYTTDVAELIDSNSKLGFKLGTQAALDALTTAVNGVFYLTSDTHRLYIGTKNGLLAPVNEGVVAVADTSELPNDAPVGTFYYITNGNILCVRSANKWVQINTDTKLSNVTVGVASSSGTSTVTTTVLDSSGVQKRGSFSIKAGDNVTVASSGSTITVSAADAPEYALDVSESNSEVKIALTKDSNELAADTLTLAAGTDIGFSFENGKLTIKNTGDMTSSTIKSAAFTAGSAGYTLGLTKEGGDIVQAALDPVIKVGKDNTSEVHFSNNVATLPVYSQTDVDNKLKELEYELNALRYKGATTGTLPSAEDTVSIGDVYMLSTTATVTVNGTAKSYDAGTLFIAQAKTGTTEDSDGYLAPANIQWTVVENYSTDTQYQFANGGTTSSVTISQHQGASITTVGGFEVKAANVTLNDNISVTGAEVDGKEVISIAHKEHDVEEAGATSADATNASKFLYQGLHVESVATDKAGHLTQVTKAKINVPAPTLVGGDSDRTVTTSTASNVTTATQTSTVRLSNAGAEINNIQIKTAIASESLSVSVDANKAINVDLVWGSF